MSEFHDAVQDVARHAGGNGEPDPLIAAGARVDGGVDADHLAAGVDQGAAGVPGVDGGVGLDEVLVVGEPQTAAPDGADDPHGHRLAKSERVADRQDDVAHLDLLGVAHLRARQRGLIDAQDGEIGAPIGPDDARAQLAAVRQRRLHLLRLLDDVVVSQDRAGLVHDHARPEAHLALLAWHHHAGELLAEEIAEERVEHERRIFVRAGHFERGDVHDRRHDSLGDGRESVLRGLGEEAVSRGAGRRTGVSWTGAIGAPAGGGQRGGSLHLQGRPVSGRAGEGAGGHKNDGEGCDMVPKGDVHCIPLKKDVIIPSRSM